MSKQVFVCDFCPDMLAGRFQTEADAQSHELSCEYNPGNRTCATCNHLVVDSRCQERRVRPKCRVFEDRKYRSECGEWTMTDHTTKFA
jgi:hypothetical protein